MGRHFVHFINRKVVISSSPSSEKEWYIRDEMDDSDPFERPQYHITRRKSGPVARIEKSDVIWLFSALSFKDQKLPVSLDAKIVTQEVCKRDGKTVFLAGPDSVWFPMADATEILKALETKNAASQKNIKLWPNPEKPIGLYLQNIREIGNPEEVISYAERIQKSAFDFISYRQKDGTQKAFKLAENLIAEKKVVFWDRYGLPRRLTERKEMVPNEQLDSHLVAKIKSAEKVWGVITEGYKDPNCYAQKEKALADELGKFLNFTSS